MLRDPIELYEYPRDWIKNYEKDRKKVESGLYILTKEGWLRRGIATSTCASAALMAAIASLYEEISEVTVKTNAGIDVKVSVKAKDGFASVKKFAGDHAFDATDGIEITAKISESGLKFGKGIGEVSGFKAVSASAMQQIMNNFKVVAEKYDYKGGAIIEVPRGEEIAKRTKNEELGIKGGISILGTTGFVEPWCDRLLKTKIEIARNYEKIAITTGRLTWKYAMENFPVHQPFVFGVHVIEAVKAHEGEKIVVGQKGLLSKFLEDLKKLNVKVVVIDAPHRWYWDRGERFDA